MRVAAIFVTFLAFSPASSAQTMTVDDVLAKLKENPFPEAYRANLATEITVNGMLMSMNGTMAFNRGAVRMIATMDMDGQSMSMRTVKDADGIQWTETQMPGMPMTQVIKMDMDAVTEALGPVASANLVGQSGVNFQPGPEMWDAWAETMHLSYEGEEEIDGETCYVLSGRYKDEVIDQIDSNGNLRAVGGVPEKINVYISTRTSFPIRMELESAQGMSGWVQFSDVDFFPEFSKDEFTYTPSEGASVMDVTQMVLQRVEQSALED